MADRSTMTAAGQGHRRRLFGFRERVLASLVTVAVTSVGFPSQPNVDAPRLPTCREISRSCATANAQACVEAADCLLRGSDPTMQQRDTKTALDLYERACEYGWGRGCSALGTLLGSGFRMAINQAASEKAYGRATRLLTEECGRGEALSCTELAGLIDQKHVRDSPEAADGWFSRGVDVLARECLEGTSRACFLAASFLSDAPDRRRDDRVLNSMLEKGCALGDGWACCQLAERTRSEVERLKLMETACTLRDVACCAKAARIHQTAGEPERAATLLDQACRAGWCSSCRDLADAYEQGRGVPMDRKRAAELRAARCTIE